MPNWLKTLLALAGAAPKPIPEALWQQTLAHYPFLARRPADELALLRLRVGEFLRDKEFTGVHGLSVTDEMAVAIAAQACLPVLHLGLHWYEDFKGIVVHPGAMLARREMMDDAGVVHGYTEELTGEAMERGPVTLSWEDVAAAGDAAASGYNVVIHEFVHKMDMRSGTADGCPPLPSPELLAAWQTHMAASYARFQTQLVMADRFGAEKPWLDAYGAIAPAEFFAVAAEAYFVNRLRFAQEFPELLSLFDRFFRPHSSPES